MNTLWQLIVSQLTAFDDAIGSGQNLAICLPALYDNHLFPRLIIDFNSQLVIIHGELGGGEEARVLFDNNSFPLVLVAVPKLQDQPKRIFGFQSPSNSIADAVKELGRPEEIGKLFAGFQKYLYQPQSSAA